MSTISYVFFYVLKDFVEQRTVLSSLALFHQVICVSIQRQQKEEIFTVLNNLFYISFFYIIRIYATDLNDKDGSFHRLVSTITIE